jgi:hypothetical protein
MLSDRTHLNNIQMLHFTPPSNFTTYGQRKKGLPGLTLLLELAGNFPTWSHVNTLSKIAVFWVVAPCSLVEVYPQILPSRSLVFLILWSFQKNMKEFQATVRP